MFLPNGLARAAVRFRPAAFVGTFVALAMAALIVSACGILLETGLRASVPPVRYAAAPVVAAADQQVHLTTGSGEDETEVSTSLPDTVRLDAGLVREAAAAPGAAAAVGDVTFPVRGAADAGAGPALTGHGWGSTAFTGTKLTAGESPRTSAEVVLDKGAAEQLGARVGASVRLDTAQGAQDFTVSGIAADGPGTAWFTDARAGQLSGHPGKVDAIAVLADPGTTPAALAGQVSAALGARAQVHTGDDRGAVEDASLAGAEETLMGLGGSFGGVAAMVAAFTASGTVALSVGQRRREFALLRAIGTTPRQVRRTIATEALLIAPLAGLVGCLPGIALAHWWFGRLRDKGAIPEAVDLTVSWLPLLAATAMTVGTALLAGYAAARRPSKIKPGLALAEAGVEPLRAGYIRTPLGVAALVGGVAFAGIAANGTGDNAAQASLGVVMLFMTAVGLLGPLIARGCAALFGLPMRAAGAAGSLAAANSRTNARRLASAITPIVLAIAFSSTLVFMHTSENRVSEERREAGIIADHIVSDPAGLPSDAAARAAAVPGVTSAVGLSHTAVLVEIDGGLGDKWFQSASTQGVTGSGRDLATVQDLDIRTGSLAALGKDTVAVDEAFAATAKVRTGDRLALRLPDGTKASPRVIATYGRGLGLSQVTLGQGALTTHTSSPFVTELFVRGAPEAAAALGKLGAVTDESGYASAVALDRELNAWANTTMAAVLGGFAAIAAANTLVMTVFDRRRELGVLRLIGSTRRQVRGMVRWEALLVSLAGITLGSGIALATLIPMMNALTGEAPYIPPAVYGSFVAATLLLGWASTSLPARAAMR
ncbi:MAG TPA: FtsX-like permease family protein [Streptomyces sp.]|nr:FtsX-like permease family protein [Streptomyces sp.]